MAVYVNITPKRARYAAIVVALLVSFIAGRTTGSRREVDLTESERLARRDMAALPAGFVVKDLNGVDLSKLDEQKRLTALDVMNKVPCLASGGGVSVARCRRDSPSCPTSQRMADFIVEMAAKGWEGWKIIVAVYEKAIDESPTRPRLSEKTVDLKTEGFPFAGTAAAPVKIVVVFDYTSAISRKALASSDEILKLYPGKVKVVYWPLPMTKVRPESAKAAKVALAAHILTGFGKVHPLLIASEGRAGDVEIASLAQKTGLTTLAEETESQKTLDLMDKLIASAGDAGIESPPVFFVNGRRVIGPVPNVCFLMDAVQASLNGSLKNEYRSLEERISP